MTCSPNHHWLWKLHTGLQATWILCLSALSPDSGTLISKLNAKFTFIWKEDFGPLSNSLVIFLHSPGKMLLTLFLFQKWLGSPFPEDVWAWWLLVGIRPCPNLQAAARGTCFVRPKNGDGPHCRTQDPGGVVGSNPYIYLNLTVCTPWSLNPPISTLNLPFPPSRCGSNPAPWMFVLQWGVTEKTDWICMPCC